MNAVHAYVGLDVHKETIAVAVADGFGGHHLQLRLGFRHRRPQFRVFRFGSGRQSGRPQTIPFN
jgi:hypothetical protein